MTEVVKDTIKEVDVTIDGEDWLVADAIVELSQTDSPNYVDINKMIPDSEDALPEEGGPDQLIGEPFELRVDNELISKRDTGAEEETLLFAGNLANISATGERIYEGIAYDPSQQGFNSSQGAGMMNQRITLFWPYYGYLYFYGEVFGTSYEPRTKKASTVVTRVMAEMGISDYDIQLTEGGVTRSGPGGEVTGAYDRDVTFSKNNPTIKKILNYTAEVTESTYWFDKSGTFHFGVPDPTKHILHYITDASDGMTTGPYQSVRVIGSGISSSEGWSRQSMVPEERVVKEYVAVQGEGSEFTATPLSETGYSDPPEPVFEYRNAEISTEKQARSTAKKIAEDLAKQQADGKISVVGFPEVQPLDAIKMPQAQDEGKDNYFPNQPMGGYSYSVYKVKHKLNASDGFKTDIYVAGLVGASGIVIDEDNPKSPSSQEKKRRRELRREHGMGGAAVPGDIQ